MASVSEERLALARLVEEFDPSDDYHADEGRDAKSYYAAVDRCVRLLRGEISDWRDKGAPATPGGGA